MILNLAETADAFGVEPKTIKAWAARGCPVLEKGSRGIGFKFSLPDVGRWREAEARRLIAEARSGDVVSDDDEDTETLAIARRRKLSAEASLAELQLEIAQGKVLSIDEVTKGMGDDYARVRARLLALPPKLAALVDGKTINERKELAESLIREALDELSYSVVEDE